MTFKFVTFVIKLSKIYKAFEVLFFKNFVAYFARTQIRVHLQFNTKIVNLTSPLLCSFSKNVSLNERVKPPFFVTFNIIICHIIPEIFIEIPQVVQKI